MYELLGWLLIAVVVVAVLVLRAKGAAIRKAAPPPPRPPDLSRPAEAQPVFTATSIELVPFFFMGFFLAAMLPGIGGCFLVLETALNWLRTAEWRPRPVSDFLDATMFKSGHLAGWNLVVDWLFSRSAWLAGIVVSFLAWVGPIWLAAMVADWLDGKRVRKF